GVADVRLTLHDVLPRRGVRVLEVGHEDSRTRVERVGHHLAFNRPRDLAPAILKIVRRGRDSPLTLAQLARLRQEPGVHAGVELCLAFLPTPEQLESPRVELTLEALDERERLAREDLVPYSCVHAV